MAHLKKRGKIWWAYYYDNSGKYKGRSLGVTQKVEAEAEAKKIDRILASERMTDQERYAAWGSAIEEQHEKVKRQTARGQAQQAELEKLWESHQEAQREEASRSSMSFDQFWAQYEAWCREGNRAENTLIAYRTVYRKYKDLMNPGQLAAIGSEEIAEFGRRCRESGVADSGVKQYLASLQGMFSTAIAEGWLKGSNPVHVSWKNRQDHFPRFLDREEIIRLLAAAKEVERNAYLFIAVAVYAGLHKDEVANLLWEEIQFDRVNPLSGEYQPIITLQAHRADPPNGIQQFSLKSKRARVIPLKEELRQILLPYRRTSGYVIESLSGKEVKRNRFFVPHTFKTAEEKAGVYCSPHALRHTFASHLAMSGISIFKISKWLGHSTVQLTADTYAHLQAHDEDINAW